MPGPSLRISYNPSIPFSVRISVLLCIAYGVGFVGLFFWNFFTSAKQTVCTSYFSSNFDPNSCEATPLEFAKPYYTRPVDNAAASGNIGTFPWTPLAFGHGEDNGPVDYSILTINWTANPLQCVMYEQYITLLLSSEDSTINACYYCGSQLRTLCTAVDGARSQLPARSASAVASLLEQFDTLSVYAHLVSTTAQQGATVGSVRINVQRPVPGLASGVLPYDTSSTFVLLGTDQVGSFPIYPNSSNAGVANVASLALQISGLVEQATSLDLQPANSTGLQRTLQASYICRACSKQYKPTLEIITILITGIFAVLTPAFAALKLLAEWTTADEDHPFFASQQQLQQQQQQAAYAALQQYPSNGSKMPVSPMATPSLGTQYHSLNHGGPSMQQMPQQPYQ